MILGSGPAGLTAAIYAAQAHVNPKEDAVIGGSDAALEEAMTLTNFASGATIVHRSDTLTASPYHQEKVFHDDKIHVL